MKLFRLPLLILFAFAFTLMGCGQKGPLFLPEKQTVPKIEVEPTTQKADTPSQDVNTDKTTQQTSGQQSSSSAVTDEVK